MPRRKRNIAERDRLHGQGLPASLDSNALTRIARRLTGEGEPAQPQRLTSRVAAMAAGFEPLDGRPDMYRKGHAVWALRPAEDGEGFVLVRQQEELAVDMRRTASKNSRVAFLTHAEERHYVDQAADLLEQGREFDAVAEHVYSELLQFVPDDYEIQAATQSIMDSASSRITFTAPGLPHQAQQVDAQDLYDAHEVMHGRDPEYGGGEMTSAIEDLMGDDGEADEDPDDETEGEGDDDMPFAVGDKVGFIHRGQLADAMIVLINPSEQLADLLVGGEGMKGEHVQDIPMEHLMAPCGEDEPMHEEPEGDMLVELVPLLGGGGFDPFEPDVEPSSKSAQLDDGDPPYERGHSFGQETDIGNVVEVMTPFRPILYGGQITLPPGRLFEIDGYSPGTDPRADEMGHVDVPNPLYPEEGDDPSQFIRLRIKDDETGVIVHILPLEFERFMSARGDFPRKPVPHKSRSKPREHSPSEVEDAQRTTVIPGDDSLTGREDTVLSDAPGGSRGQTMLQQQRGPTISDRPPKE